MRCPQAQLARLRACVVGAGAIGSELLKCLAMIGVASGEGGGVTIADDVRSVHSHFIHMRVAYIVRNAHQSTLILSDLSRHALARFAHIGSSKATVVAAAAAAINPGIHVRALTRCIGE